MCPNEKQREEAQRRRQAARAKRKDIKDHNLHLLKCALEGSQIFYQRRYEADEIFGMVALLTTGAGRQLLRESGRDDRSCDDQMLVVEVPGPVPVELDLALTAGHALRRHTYAKNRSGIWLYRGRGDIQVIDALVAEVGGRAGISLIGQESEGIDTHAQPAEAPVDILTAASQEHVIADTPPGSEDVAPSSRPLEETPAVADGASGPTITAHTSRPGIAGRRRMIPLSPGSEKRDTSDAALLNRNASDAADPIAGIESWKAVAPIARRDHTVDST